MFQKCIGKIKLVAVHREKKVYIYTDKVHFAFIRIPNEDTSIKQKYMCSVVAPNFMNELYFGKK